MKVTLMKKNLNRNVTARPTAPPLRRRVLSRDVGCRSSHQLPFETDAATVNTRV